jgi:hypothetical protein
VPEKPAINKRAFIDRNVRIINERRLESTEKTDLGRIRSAILVTAKNATVPDGWTM